MAAFQDALYTEFKKKNKEIYYFLGIYPEYKKECRQELHLSKVENPDLKSGELALNSAHHQSRVTMKASLLSLGCCLTLVNKGFRFDFKVSFSPNML